MSPAILVTGETRAMTDRLVTAIRSALPDAVVATGWAPAHEAATKAAGGLLLSVLVRADELRLEWGRPYRDETDQRVVEWLTGAHRPVPRVYDPEAKLHGPGKGARVVDAEAVAKAVVVAVGAPPRPELLAALHDTTARTVTAEQEMVAARAARDLAVRAAMKAGVPVQSIVDATGLARSRVYQIRDGQV